MARKKERPDTATQAEASILMIFDRQARAALAVVSLTLLACGVGFRIAVHAADLYLRKEAVELRVQLSNIPKRLGQWTASGPDVKLTAEVEEELGTAQYLNRVYVNQRLGRGTAVSVHITYYTGLIDTVPHIPDRCLVAAGATKASLPLNIDLNVDRSDWISSELLNRRTGDPYPVYAFTQSITGRPITVHMPLGNLKLRITEFRHEDHPNARIYAGYFFIANGQTTARPEGVRVFAFDLTTKYAYYTKIQFTMVLPESVERSEFVDSVSDLLNDLLPELMRCLPDWAEVESWSQPRFAKRASLTDS